MDTLLRRVLLRVLPPTILVLLCIGLLTTSVVTRTTTSELRHHLEQVALQSASAVALKLTTIAEAATSLAGNGLIVNSVVDAQDRMNYLPTLFNSLRIPGPENVKITLADYRGRPIAANGGLSSYRQAAWLERVMAGEDILLVTPAGLTVATPVLYAGRPEGVIVIEYGAAALVDILALPFSVIDTAVTMDSGALLYRSSRLFEQAIAQSAEDSTWIIDSLIIPGFPDLRIIAGQSKRQAYFAVDRQTMFLLIALALSFAAVTAGVVLTAFWVRAPLAKAMQEAEQASRVKSEFLASMSHEIRSPLNGVLGMASLLLDGKLESDQRKKVETIQDSGGALLALINDILDLSKIEAGELTLEVIDFELSQLLDSLYSIWRPQIFAKGLEFRQDETGLFAPVLQSDPTRIRQILFNLLSNAFKFTESGHIALSVGQTRRRDGTIETKLTVRDTGVGIAADKQPLLFKSFSQADSSITRRFGGTGLGLAISKNLAEALGGTIGVESSERAGSTFWFSFVCPEGDAGRIAPPETGVPSASPDAAPLRILVAEDNNVNQQVIKGMLEKAGHRVFLVGNGVEAVNAVISTPYDLVLMDFQMPEMDGVTATRRIRELEAPGTRIPIIALTANAMKGDRENYLEAGMDDYVSKPIEPRLLFAAIQRCCRGEGDGGPVADEPAGPDEAPDEAPDESAVVALRELLGEVDALSDAGTGNARIG